ncbi:MAG: thermonuclease family protein [Planctomycetota bacterium]|nr:thermonuclease family protein [Planctomycetota bacterium]
MRHFTLCVVAVSLASLPLLHAGEAPDGTAFAHRVLGVDGPALVRLRFCGIPIQVRLANLQFKGAESENEALKCLKDTLKFGTLVRIELEPELAGDAAPPPAQLFVGDRHINVELVKRGLAVSDGRSQKCGAALQAAQLEAMTKKLGVWALPDKEPKVAVAPTPPPATVPPAEPRPPAVAAATTTQPAAETALPGYSGPVVADLSSREYHFPGSRYARNIRSGARIEYKSPDEAERAGKLPSPFSFPDRTKALAEKQTGAGAGRGGGSVVENARKALAEALTYMQEARRVSKANNVAANENWRKAAKLLTEHLDRLIPIADADPNNKDLQKLTEEMSMNLYSCKKYQSL